MSIDRRVIRTKLLGLYFATIVLFSLTRKLSPRISEKYYTNNNIPNINNISVECLHYTGVTFKYLFLEKRITMKTNT